MQNNMHWCCWLGEGKRLQVTCPKGHLSEM